MLSFFETGTKELRHLLIKNKRITRLECDEGVEATVVAPSEPTFEMPFSGLAIDRSHALLHLVEFSTLFFACTLVLGSLGSEHSLVSVDSMRHDHFLGAVRGSTREKRSSELESIYDNGVCNKPVHKFVNAVSNNCCFRTVISNLQTNTVLLLS